MKQRSLRGLLVAFVIIAGTVTVPAQDATAESEPDETEKTIEELYLESDVSLRSIESMVTSYDRSAQRMGIQALSQRAADGLVDTSTDEFVAIATTALRSGVGNISNNRSALPDSYHPLVRIEAARALGGSSNPTARQALVTTLRTDPEPSVKAAAMLGLGQQGVDPDGAVSYEIAVAMQKELAVRGDEAMLYGGLQALDALVLSAGADDIDPIVRQTVVEIITSGLSRLVREKAVSVLNKM